MHAAGLRPSAPVVGDWSARSGYEAGLEIARRDEVTAVFCANDQMALGLLRALHESGRSVPDDVSVVGFDDLPEAQWASPPLTTVRQPLTEMGRMAARVALQMVAGERVDSPRVELATELVVRESAIQA